MILVLEQVSAFRKKSNLVQRASHPIIQVELCSYNTLNWNCLKSSIIDLSASLNGGTANVELDCLRSNVRSVLSANPQELEQKLVDLVDHVKLTNLAPVA